MRVREHLQLDVARCRNIFLDQHARVAERTAGLALRGFKRRLEIGMLVDAPHAFAAAARDSLDQHRVADLVSLLLEERRLLALAVIARHDRHAGSLHQCLSAAFQSHGADRRRRWPDEDDVCLGACLSELRILGEEAVARMDAFCA